VSDSSSNKTSLPSGSTERERERESESERVMVVVDERHDRRPTTDDRRPTTESSPLEQDRSATHL
jgi:hypothetical protein